MTAPPTSPSPPPPDPSAPPRDPRLDGLRGVAIGLVFLYHASFFWLAESPGEIALLALPALGLYGVDLFFVLSGFLITGILLRTRGAPGYYGRFYARRSLRIFPAYYAVLLLFLVVFPALTPQAEAFWKPDAERETLWYWTYLSNYQVAATGRFHHHFLFLAWSLAIEEQFYLVWPALVAWLGRTGLRRLCIGILIGAPLLRAGLLGAGASPLVPYVLTPCRLDALAAGALVALLATAPGGLAAVASRARRLAPAALGGFVALAAAVSFAPALAGGGAPTGLMEGESRLLFYTSHPAVIVVGYSLLAVGFAAALVAVLTAGESALARGLAWGPLGTLGRYSYGLYLLHRLGIAVARNFVEPTQAGEWPFALAQIAFWAVSLALSLALAWVSWQVVEAPFLRLKRRFAYAEGPGAGRAQ